MTYEYYISKKANNKINTCYLQRLLYTDVSSYDILHCLQCPYQNLDVILDESGAWCRLDRCFSAE